MNPLTDEEIAELRMILEEERRRKWLWVLTRKIAIWVAAIVGGMTVGWDFIKRVAKAAVGP